MPTDPSFRELSANEDLLRFTVHWLKKQEEDNFNTWTRALGIYWDRDAVAAMAKGKGDKSATAPTEAFIPLAISTNPELVEGLQKMFRISKGGGFIGGGEYTTTTGEEVVNLGDLSPEDFLDWANRATGVMRDVADTLTEQQRTVTIKEGDTGDAQMDRIRQQVAQSKRFK